MLLFAVVGTQITRLQPLEPHVPTAMAAQTGDGVESTPGTVPTITIFRASPVAVPTLALPTATPLPLPTVRPTRSAPPRRHHAHRPARHVQKAATPVESWIWAYLTSYCPGSAGWLSSSGLTVFYGMLANNYYPYGTHVYLPMIGITGVVEDRLGAFAVWNHFDVWSNTCYGTPTGWFRVAVIGR